MVAVAPKPAVAADATDAVGKRFCSLCGEEKPLAEFRLRYRGRKARHAECNGCRPAMECLQQLRKNEQDRNRRARKRQTAASAAITSIANERRGVLYVVALVKAMMQRCGGLQGAVDAWWGALQRAKKNPRACRLQVKSFDALFVMTEVVERYQREQGAKAEADERRATRRMSDRQLDRQLIDGIALRAKLDPEFAAMVARRTGWSVPGA